MRRFLYALAIAAFMGNGPAFADLSDVGDITLSNSWSQAFIVNNAGTGSAWDRVEFFMWPVDSPPGFEKVGDSVWQGTVVNPEFAMFTGPARNSDLLLKLTFNGDVGPLQFVGFQFLGNTLLRGETTLVEYNHGWSFKLAPDYNVPNSPVPEPPTLFLAGCSLLVLSAVMQRKMGRNRGRIATGHTGT